MEFTACDRELTACASQQKWEERQSDALALMEHLSAQEPSVTCYDAPDQLEPPESPQKIK
eukprot:4637071-Amphidinium_carterae.1